MPGQGLIQNIIDEWKGRPWTMLTLLALIAYSAYAFDAHVHKNDLATVQSAVVSDVRKLESKLDKLLVINITTAIQERRREFCKTSDSELRRLLAQSINELRESYREITGQPYVLESCESVARRE